MIRRLAAATVVACLVYGIAHAQAEKGVTIVPRKQVQTERARRWAVLIGVDKYDDELGIGSLKYSAQDMKLLHRVLTGPSGGFDPENVLLMTRDAKNPRHTPTYSHIVSMVPRWLLDARPQDDVLIAFSGHGIAEKGEAYLLPSSAMRGNLRLTAIPLRLIREWLDACKAARKILVVDACHSGAGKAARAMDDVFKSDLDRGEGFVRLASCGPAQKSNEDAMLTSLVGTGHGVFTYYLAEGLEGRGDFDRDGRVDVDEAYRYAYNRTCAWARNNGLRQDPMKSGRVTGTVTIAYHRPRAVQNVEVPRTEPVRGVRGTDLLAYGGTGSDGAFDPPAIPGHKVTLDTTDHEGGFHCTIFRVPAGVTVQIVGEHPARIFSQSGIRIKGIVEVPPQHGPRVEFGKPTPLARGICGGHNGGPLNAGPGEGPGGGGAGITVKYDVRHSGGAGAGGGYGTPGKDGGNAEGKGGKGGVTYGASAYPKLLGGSGGGGGHESHRRASCGMGGGAGGGVLMLSTAGDLEVRGSVRANGGDGGYGQGHASGGGGGSGGIIVLRALGAVRMERGASVETRGGKGGKPGQWGGAAGGDGGAGRIVFECPKQGRTIFGKVVGVVRRIDMPGGGTADAGLPSEERSKLTYTVIEGDTLWTIAEKFLGSGTKWREIARANDLSATTPRPVVVGTVLKIPDTAGGGHDVPSGD